MVTAENLRDLDLAELLRAAAAFVALRTEANRAQDLVVALARRVTGDSTSSDEDVVRQAGALALKVHSPPQAVPA